MARNLRSADRSQRTASAEPQPTSTGRTLRSASQQPASGFPTELPAATRTRKRGNSAASNTSTVSRKPRKTKKPKKAAASRNASPIIEAHGEDSLASPSESEQRVDAEHQQQQSDESQALTLSQPYQDTQPQQQLELELELEQELQLELEQNLEQGFEQEPQQDSEAESQQESQHQSEPQQDTVQQSIEITTVSTEVIQESTDVVQESTQVAQDPTDAFPDYIQPSKAQEQSHTPTPDSSSDSLLVPASFNIGSVKTSKHINSQYVQSRLPAGIPVGLSNWFGLANPCGRPTPGVVQGRDSETLWQLAEAMTDVERTALIVEQFGRIKDLEDTNNQHEKTHNRQLTDNEILERHTKTLERDVQYARAEAKGELLGERRQLEYQKSLVERESLKRKRDRDDIETEALRISLRDQREADEARRRLNARVSAKDIIIEGAVSKREADILTEMLVRQGHGEYPPSMMERYRDLLSNMGHLDRWDVAGMHQDWLAGHWPYPEHVLEAAREEYRRKGWPLAEIAKAHEPVAQEPDLSMIEEEDEDEFVVRKNPMHSNDAYGGEYTMSGGLQSSPFDEDVAADTTPQGWTGSLRNVIGSVRKYIPTFSRHPPKTAPVRRSRPMIPDTPQISINGTAKMPQQAFTFNSPASPSAGRGLAPKRTFQSRYNSHDPNRQPDFSASTSLNAQQMSDQEISHADAMDADDNQSATTAILSAPASVASTSASNAESASAPTTETPRSTRSRRLGPVALKERSEREARQRALKDTKARQDAQEAEQARITEARAQSDNAMRTQHPGEKRQVRKVTVRVGDLRKPILAPNTPGTYGFTEGFYSDESDDEMVELDEDDSLIMTPPNNKRQKVDNPIINTTRMSHQEASDAFARVTYPAHPEAANMGDPSRPQPYIGTMFATPADASGSANVFTQHRSIQEHNEDLADLQLSPISYGRKFGVWTGPKIPKGPKHSGTFRVPDSSDDESDEEDSPTAGAASGAQLEDVYGPDPTGDESEATTSNTDAPEPSNPTITNIFQHAALPGLSPQDEVSISSQTAAPAPEVPQTPTPAMSNIFQQASPVAAQTPAPVQSPFAPQTPVPSSRQIPQAPVPVEHDAAAALARARSEADKYKPKTPSGLRTADRVASSPINPPITPPAQEDEQSEPFAWPVCQRLPTPDPEVQAALDWDEANLTQEQKDQRADDMWTRAWDDYTAANPHLNLPDWTMRGVAGAGARQNQQ